MLDNLVTRTCRRLRSLIEDDAGEVAPTVVVIAGMVALAIAVIALITAKVIEKANGISL